MECCNKYQNKNNLYRWYMSSKYQYKNNLHMYQEQKEHQVSQKTKWIKGRKVCDSENAHEYINEIIISIHLINTEKCMFLIPSRKWKEPITYDLRINFISSQVESYLYLNVHQLSCLEYTWIDIELLLYILSLRVRILELWFCITLIQTETFCNSSSSGRKA
jgi:hypothetical protein